MSRRALVLSLALLETVTLLAGTAAALTGPVTLAATTTHATAAAPEPALRPNVPVVYTTQAKAVTKAAPKAKPAVHHARPKAHHSAPRRTRHAVATPKLSFAARLTQAVNRIPGYHTGDAVWSITPSYGHWGVADIYGGVVYISPNVPSNRLYDVAAHEWSHLLSVKPYDGDVNGALDAMNAYFGGSGLQGAERAADCMARQLGATWTHYTPCSNAHWRAGAKRLLSHQRL
jgi:hypothetical protein